MSRLLCDAGVWLAAANPGERFHPGARHLLESLGDRGEPVGALDLTLYEVANVATIRWGSARDASALVAFVADCAAMSLVPWSFEMLDAASAMAHERGLSVYDAAYVATAEALGWTLVSTDVRDLVARGLAVTPDEILV